MHWKFAIFYSFDHSMQKMCCIDTKGTIITEQQNSSILQILWNMLLFETPAYLFTQDDHWVCMLAVYQKHSQQIVGTLTYCRCLCTACDFNFIILTTNVFLFVWCLTVWKTPFWSHSPGEWSSSSSPSSSLTVSIPSSSYSVRQSDSSA